MCQCHKQIVVYDDNYAFPEIKLSPRWMLKVM